GIKQSSVFSCTVTKGKLQMIQRARSSFAISFILGLWLLLASACSSSLNAAAPSAAPAATSGSADAARPTVQAQPTPVLGTPKALRDDIQIRKILETGGGIVRLKRDPSTDTIYYMTNKADIYQLIIKPGNASGTDKPYTLAKIGGDPDLIAAGLAF